MTLIALLMAVATSTIAAVSRTVGWLALLPILRHMKGWFRYRAAVLVVPFLRWSDRAHHAFQQRWQRPERLGPVDLMRVAMTELDAAVLESATDHRPQHPVVRVRNATEQLSRVTRLPLHRYQMRGGAVINPWCGYQFLVQEWRGTQAGPCHHSRIYYPCGDLDMEEWSLCFGRLWNIHAIKRLAEDWRTVFSRAWLTGREQLQETFPSCPQHPCVRIWCVRQLLRCTWLMMALAWWSHRNHRLHRDQYGDDRLHPRFAARYVARLSRWRPERRRVGPVSYLPPRQVERSRRLHLALYLQQQRANAEAQASVA
jgi:hypothetical protein